MADTHSQTFEETDDEFEHESQIDHGPEQIYGKLIKLGGMASTTYIGQFVLEKIDKVLNVLETTGKWSLPRKYFYFMIFRFILHLRSNFKILLEII